MQQESIPLLPTLLPALIVVRASTCPLAPPAAHRRRLVFLAGQDTRQRQRESQVQTPKQHVCVKLDMVVAPPMESLQCVANAALESLKVLKTTRLARNAWLDLTPLQKALPRAFSAFEAPSSLSWECHPVFHVAAVPT